MKKGKHLTVAGKALFDVTFLTWDPVLCHSSSHSVMTSCLFLKLARNSLSLGSIHFMFSLSTPFKMPFSLPFPSDIYLVSPTHCGLLWQLHLKLNCSLNTFYAFPGLISPFSICYKHIMICTYLPCLWLLPNFLEYKPHEGRESCPFYSLPYLQSLE